MISYSFDICNETDLFILNSCARSNLNYPSRCKSRIQLRHYSLPSFRGFVNSVVLDHTFGYYTAVLLPCVEGFAVFQIDQLSKITFNPKSFYFRLKNENYYYKHLTILQSFKMIIDIFYLLNVSY